jgi:hypothetical protein
MRRKVSSNRLSSSDFLERTVMESSGEAGMPQPLSSIDRKLNINGKVNPFEREPKLAAMAMEVIGRWSLIDAHIEFMFAHFIKTDFEIAAVMLLAIHSDARQSAIQAAAHLSLTDDDYKLFVAVSQTIRASRNRRHDFAHHIWRVCDEVPGALILVNPKEWNTASAKVHGVFHRNESFVMPLWGVPWDNSKWMVYRERDFAEAIKTAERAHWLVTAIRGITFPLTPKDKADSMRAELLKDPQIQFSIQKQSKNN